MELMLSAALLAADEPSDWYFSASAYQEGAELSFDGIGTVLDIDSEMGLRVGFGKPLSNNWNLEFEFGKNEWNYSTQFAVGEFSYTHYSAMFGYKYSVDESFTIVPQFGLGLTNWELDEFDVDFGALSAEGTDITFKFGINAEYEINESLTARVGYRLENTPFEILGVSGDFTGSGLIFGASFSF